MLCPEVEGLKEKPPKPDHLLVAFYGESSYEWLPESKLKLLDCDTTIASTKASTKATNKALQEAIADTE